MEKSTYYLTPTLLNVTKMKTILKHAEENYSGSIISVLFAVTV